MKEKTMIEIAEENNAGWSFVDEGNGTILIKKD